MRFPDAFRRLPKWGIFALALAMLAVLGAIDYQTPFELTLQMFYTAPVLFAAWYGTRSSAMVVAVLSGIVWWLANGSQQVMNPEQYAWAAVNRMVLLSLVAAGGSAMAAHREAINARLFAMERTRELEEEIVRVSEREKMSIGRDLHDGLCQDLAAIDCAVACLQSDLEEKELPEAEAAAFIQKQISRAMVEARDLARGIFPVHVDEEGFLAALEDLVDATNRLRQLSVRLHVSGDMKIKEPQTAMHLYRIAQEALSNAGKHAEANEVHIDLAREDHTLTMMITDDGSGLPPEISRKKGLGLQTMNYRARSMGAKLEIVNRTEGGTRVRCAVQMAA